MLKSQVGNIERTWNHCGATKSDKKLYKWKVPIKFQDSYNLVQNGQYKSAIWISQDFSSSFKSFSLGIRGLCQLRSTITAFNQLQPKSETTSTEQW